MHTRGIFLLRAILNEECANPVIDYHQCYNNLIKCSMIIAYLIGIIHAHRYTFTLEVVDIESGCCRTVLRSVHQLKLAGSWRYEIG
jgi:hypothetical protein